MGTGLVSKQMAQIKGARASARTGHVLVGRYLTIIFTKVGQQSTPSDGCVCVWEGNSKITHHMTLSATSILQRGRLL